jgi:hypothetical protein
MYNKDFYYKDSSMLGVIAPRGVGKTLLLTAIAHEELVEATNFGYPDFKIYHNGFLNPKWKGWKEFGNDRLVEFGLEEIIETVDTEHSTMENGLVLIDEIASIQDNRYGAMGYGNVLFSHWVIMIRKIGLSILWAGQNEEVDRRLKLQCDVVGYPVVARKRRGKEVGVTWVYQNGTYSFEGNRRRFFYPNLDKLWNAYDTSRIIKSRNISKTDINLMESNRIEEKIYDTIYRHLKDKDEKKLSAMEVKKMTEVDWNIKKIDQFLTYLGKRVRNNKGTFTFNELFKEN